MQSRNVAEFQLPRIMTLAEECPLWESVIALPEWMDLFPISHAWKQKSCDLQRCCRQSKGCPEWTDHTEHSRLLGSAVEMLDKTCFAALLKHHTGQSVGSVVHGWVHWSIFSLHFWSSKVTQSSKCSKWGWCQETTVLSLKSGCHKWSFLVFPFLVGSTNLRKCMAKKNVPMRRSTTWLWQLALMLVECISCVRLQGTWGWWTFVVVVGGSSCHRPLAKVGLSQFWLCRSRGLTLLETVPKCCCQVAWCGSADSGASN